MRNLFRSLSLVLALLLGAGSVQPAQAVTIHGLNWEKDNDAANSDIRLVWSGSNFLSRTAHTAIWRYNPHQQNGYYAVAWHAPNSGSFVDTYSYGTHPWPGDDCDVNGSGQGIHGNSSSAVHCWEQAAVGVSADWLATAGTNPGYSVVKNQWYLQARRVRTGGACGSDYEHTFFPDLVNFPSRSIITCLASITGGGATPAFYFGGSDWSVSGSANNETLAGKLRGIQLYSTGLSDADIATEAANQYSNSPVTAAGIANVWYMNQDPTVSDVTDKSGAGHSPSWANANRPTDWDSTYSSGSTGGRRALMGVGN